MADKMVFISMANAISSGSRAPWLGVYAQNQLSALQAQRINVMLDITLPRCG
jgi:hypothetical protein